MWGVSKFSDLVVIALGITDEAFGNDSENILFHRLYHESKDDLPKPDKVQCLP